MRRGSRAAFVEHGGQRSAARQGRVAHREQPAAWSGSASCGASSTAGSPRSWVSTASWRSRIWKGRWARSRPPPSRARRRARPRASAAPDAISGSCRSTSHRAGHRASSTPGGCGQMVASAEGPQRAAGHCAGDASIVTVRPKSPAGPASRVSRRPRRRTSSRVGCRPAMPQVLISKYADHLPLYRQSQLYARSGVDLHRSTLAGWVGRRRFI